MEFFLAVSTEKYGVDRARARFVVAANPSRKAGPQPFVVQPPSFHDPPRTHPVESILRVQIVDGGFLNFFNVQDPQIIQQPHPVVATKPVHGKEKSKTFQNHFPSVDPSPMHATRQYWQRDGHA